MEEQKLFRVLSSSSQACSTSSAAPKDDGGEDVLDKDVLVLAVTGRVPAPDVLQEILPVLRVKSLTGHSIGGTDELLRTTVNRTSHTTCDVPVQPQTSMRLKRTSSRRPAPIDTFQGIQRSSPRHVTSPIRSRASPVATARTPASHAIPPLTNMLEGESSPHGTLDIVWGEIQVALQGCDRPLRFTLECRSSIDGTLLCSSSTLETGDFVSANQAPKVHEVLVCSPSGLHDESSSTEREMGDIFLRNVAGTLQVRGEVLSKRDASRRKAAWALCKEDGLFAETIDEQDSAGDTALMRATRGKRLMIARRLLAAGADASLVNHEGACAYQAAAEHLPLLLPWLRASFAGGYDPLLLSAREGRLAHVRSILEGGGGRVAIDACNDDGYTALMLAGMNGHVEVMRCLVAASACLDARCHQGFTPLMKAAALARPLVARFLLEQKAAPDVARCDGSTALLDASAEGHADMVKVLLAFSADVNARRHDGVSALVSAIAGGAVCHDTLHLLIQAGADVNLAYEASHCTIGCLRSASKRRVDASSFQLPLGQGERGCTPLMCASWKGFHYTADLLIAQKADLNAQSASGYTAIQGATGNMHANVVALLLARGADLGVPDNDGTCCLDECARLDDNRELEDMLCQAAGIPDITINSRRKYAASRLQKIQSATSQARRRNAQSQSNSVHSTMSSRATSRQVSPRLGE